MKLFAHTNTFHIYEIMYASSLGPVKKISRVLFPPICRRAVFPEENAGPFLELCPINAGVIIPGALSIARVFGVMMLHCQTRLGWEPRLMR